ncbi:dihydrodipicolinate synthase family protein [Pseudomonas putida]|uniref:dihydrodipicolinate synthase family protein n=1 Tax=Pseudomonas putida TaxID=303 RepID=UPI003F38703A
MNNGKIKLSGSIVAVVTPFTESGDIDASLFVENIQRLMEEGAGGILVAGSTGEAWALDTDEKVRLFKLAREVLGKDATLLGGTGEIRTDRTIEATLAAKDAGVDGVLLVPPYFVDRTPESVLAHFRAVSDAARCPIVLYNHPGSTGLNLNEQYLEQLSALEWVVATKESAGDFHQLCRLINTFGERIDVLTGVSSRQGIFGAMMGSPALVSSLEPQVLGREGIQLFDLGRDPSATEAAIKAQKKCIEVDKIMSIGTGPANLKAAMRLVGRPAGYCRGPIIELNNQEVARVEELLNQAGVTTVA